MTLILIILGACALIGVVRGLVPEPKQARERRAEATRRVIEEVKAAQACALVLTPASGGNASWLGGGPTVPPSFEWPMSPDGPLTFAGQFDLAEVREAGGPTWLPADGALLAFHHEDWGFADLVRVIHMRAQKDDALVSMGAPDGRAYDPRSITFERRVSLPSLEWLSIDGAELERAGPAWSELANIVDKRPLPKAHHQIAGYPDEVQRGSLPLEAELEWRRQGGPGRKPRVYSPQDAAKDWRLLFQIDTDEDLGMSWMDCGRLYVLVREQDARAGDFSQTVTIVQTY